MIIVLDAGISREFRVVRDNRVNQNSDREAKASTQVSSLDNAQQSNNVSERRYLSLSWQFFFLE